MEFYVLFTSDGYESSSVLGVYQSAYKAVQDALDHKDRLDRTVSVSKCRVDEFDSVGEAWVFDCYVWEFEAEAEKFLSKGE